MTWSPDSQYLSFLGKSTQDPGNEKLDVFIVNINGGEPVNISNSPDTNVQGGFLAWVLQDK
jgi:Tol biopolymer transport system component